MRAARTASVVAVVLALVGATACSSGNSTAKPEPAPAVTVAWPAPADPLGRARAAGLVPEDSERLEYHVHAHLDVLVDGQPVTVPAGLGINIHDPGVHVFDTDGVKSYGGIDVPCASACISPLHTHDVTGVIHTESPTIVSNTLGQLFVEWGVRLDARCVDRYCRPDTKIAVYVDGKPITTDPRKVALSNFREIAVVIGTPPAQIPATGGF